MSILFRLKGTLLGILALTLTLPAFSQPPGMNRPDPVVSTAMGRQGVLAPQVEFQGTVFFKAVSEVATEVSGKVIAVEFEQGQRVKKGQRLVRLDDAILRKELNAMQATEESRESDLEDAKVRFERAQVLVRDGLYTPEQGDELRFNVEALRHQVESIRAEVERIEMIISKNAIYAPFDGVVLERPTEVGEWRRDGDTIAVIAREDLYEVVVNVPEDYLAWIHPGLRVAVRAGGDDYRGEVETIVRRGDIATRTFPVKVRVENRRKLYEGMSAVVALPISEEIECLLVPRDAVVREAGRPFVFRIEGTMAKRYSVKVLGHSGMFTGITSPVFTVKDQFIVKGHERLRDGTVVRILPSREAKARVEDSDD